MFLVLEFLFILGSLILIGIFNMHTGRNSLLLTFSTHIARCKDTPKLNFADGFTKANVSAWLMTVVACGFVLVYLMRDYFKAKPSRAMFLKLLSVEVRRFSVIPSSKNVETKTQTGMMTF